MSTAPAAHRRDARSTPGAATAPSTSSNPVFARHRRTRSSDGVRRLVQETRLSPDCFVYPLFITHGRRVRQPVAPMPGCYQMSADMLGREAKEIASLGIPAVLLFGIPPGKDPAGTGAYDDQGVVQQAVRAIKDAEPALVVATDVCLCEYTDHGHCGLLNDRGEVDNDASLGLLAQAAVSHADAGADLVAPSAMMDGQVEAIRAALDSSGHPGTPVMAYAAKYASGFFGPFRVAAESAPRSGDRRGYQMDPPNAREAMREIAADIDQGADIVMVKPALAYLDVIATARSRFDHPIAAYNVSGEYAMVKAAAANGWIDERRVTLEVLTAIRRAGADIIITYHAREAAGWLAGGR